jgi:serine/threonine-protein phosphatase 2A regulatory subunit B'
MKNIFVTFIFETEKHNGIAELLEILGSIINGFTLPLKDEHKEFLFKGLIPLHKPKSLALYHPQLSYCIAQFIEKDPQLVELIFKGIIRYWPQTNSAKEILFVNEIEELLSVVEPEEFNMAKEFLFTRVARCISSLHFQVAEKALTFWTNEYILGLVAENVETILPLLFGPLYFNSKHHWNKSIRTLAYNALKLFMDMDYKLFNDTIKKYKEARHKAKTDKVSREQSWQVIADLAIKNSTNGPAATPEQRAKAVDAVLEEIEQFDPNDQMFKDISAEIESNRKQARKARRKSLLPYDREVVDAISNHVSLEDLEKRNDDDDDELSGDSLSSDEEGSHEDDSSSEDSESGESESD